jgi:OOP family OmpA-OmpF porin
MTGSRKKPWRFLKINKGHISVGFDGSSGGMVSIRGRFALVLIAFLYLFFGLSGISAAEKKAYTLHVSSFQTEAEAARAVSAFKARGLESFSRYESAGSKGRWYRVFVGMVGTMKDARELGHRLQQEGAIDYYQIVALGTTSSKPVGPSQRRALAPPAGGPPSSGFRDIVYGRYVASFQYKHLAQQEAEGLTQAGWPASVKEEKVLGSLWYRVYLLPPAGTDWSGAPIAPAGAGTARRIPGFEIVGDMGESPVEEELRPPDRPNENPSICPGYTKREARLTLIRRINASVPARTYLAGLRELTYRGPKSYLDYTRTAIEMAEELAPVEGNHTRLLWGILPYSRTEYAQAIEYLESYEKIAPLSQAIERSRPDFETISGHKIMIIVSEFKKFNKEEDPVGAARRLKERFPDLCIFTIYVDADAEGIIMAHDIARVSGCGKAYDGCQALADGAYFSQMIRDIFGTPASGGRMAARSTTCPDEDGDGVCDAQDKCPGTPRGALVDHRGCWTAAFGPFFDFDKYNVKKQYLPGLRWAAEILKDEPAIVVELAGHTDWIGTDAYNMKLGMRRSLSVKRVLVSMGVPASRLKVKSYGESRPAASNATPSGRARNRRVEIHVIK